MTARYYADRRDFVDLYLSPTLVKAKKNIKGLTYSHDTKTDREAIGIAKEMQNECGLKYLTHIAVDITGFTKKRIVLEVTLKI